METYSYSAATNAFYADSMRESYTHWPSDALEVSEDIFATYSGASPEGKVRVASKKGLPAWIDIPAPSPEEYRKQAEMKLSELITQANQEIQPLQYALELNMANDEEIQLYNAWRRYSVLLRRADISTAPNVEWPISPA
ncbi:tail fiber assembly protein [Yersinia alsatica]|uniref:tail fiber assembly protein n=1 Tax=Yersinia alsatica TaxID=2890317 RepID=UPI0011A82D14|nr:tail fiber assembly protein [Yersinia alsatica]